MSMYRREWDCCGSVTETDCWAPDSCPLCGVDEQRKRAEKAEAEVARLDGSLRIAHGSIEDLHRNLDMAEAERDDFHTRADDAEDLCHDLRTMIAAQVSAITTAVPLRAYDTTLGNAVRNAIAEVMDLRAEEERLQAALDDSNSETSRLLALRDAAIPLLRSAARNDDMYHSNEAVDMLLEHAPEEICESRGSEWRQCRRLRGHSGLHKGYGGTWR